MKVTIDDDVVVPAGYTHNATLKLVEKGDMYWDSARMRWVTAGIVTKTVRLVLEPEVKCRWFDSVLVTISDDGIEFEGGCLPPRVFRPILWWLYHNDELIKDVMTDVANGVKE